MLLISGTEEPITQMVVSSAKSTGVKLEGQTAGKYTTFSNPKCFP